MNAVIAEGYVARNPRKAAKRAQVLARLNSGRDDAAQMTAALARAKRCVDCGMPLEDPVSVERGVGPTCWSKRIKASA